MLIVSALATEALPIFFNMIVNEVLAIIFSVTAILLFAEIIPQAIFTGPNQLILAYYLSPLIRGLIMIEYFIAYPISLSLDWLLGERKKRRYANEDLKTLIGLHTRTMVNEIVEQNLHGPAGISEEQSKLIAGAIDMKKYVIRDAMKKFSDVELINFHKKITLSFLRELSAQGYSRYPVYKDTKDNIIGILLVKKLLQLDRYDLSLAELDIPLRIPLIAHPKDTFNNLLAEFQKGKSHMALVTTNTAALKKRIELQYSDPSNTQIQEPIEILGIVTLEDIIERILGSPILDENDYDQKYLAYLRPTNGKGWNTKQTSRHLEKKTIEELKREGSQRYLYDEILKRGGGEMYFIFVLF